MASELFVLGTSASRAPASARQRMHLDLDEMYGALRRVTSRADLLEEAVPLATCGRLEVYGVSDHPGRAVRVLRDLVRTRTGVPRAELEAHSYVHQGDEAARHLFRVASGLDSLIFGEAQILGQVQKALEHPRTDDVAGSVLTRLFQSALAAGKRVRAETEIGRGSASVAGSALRLLAARMGTFESRTALILGSGETGALVARLLRKKGVGRLLLANRTVQHAVPLAEELGAEAHGFDALPWLLGEADLVVGAVADRADLVTARLLDPIVREDPRPRYFLDLARPRNFAMDVGELPGVLGMDVEHVFERLHAVSEARAAHVPRAHAIISEEVESFAAWRRSRETATVLRAVRDQVLALANDEAERRSRGLTEDERSHLQRFARRLARTLLHRPTLAIRGADPNSAEGRWLLRSATSLFGVPGSDGSDGFNAADTTSDAS